MEAEPEIQVMFRCNACGLQSKAKVRPRFANEDVGCWIDSIVSEVISITHWILSPMCRADKFDLAIPLIAGSNMGVGQVPAKEAKAIIYLTHHASCRKM